MSAAKVCRLVYLLCGNGVGKSRGTAKRVYVLCGNGVGQSHDIVKQLTTGDKTVDVYSKGVQEAVSCISRLSAKDAVVFDPVEGDLNTAAFGFLLAEGPRVMVFCTNADAEKVQKELASIWLCCASLTLLV